MDNDLNIEEIKEPDEIYEYEENLEETNEFFVGSMEDNMKVPPTPTTVRVFEVLSSDDVEKISTIYNNRVYVEDRLQALEVKNLLQAEEIKNLEGSLTVYKRLLERTNLNHKELLFEIHNIHVCRNEIRLLTCKIEILEEFVKKSQGLRN